MRNNTVWPLCGLGVVIASGCAGPMDRRDGEREAWHEPDRGRPVESGSASGASAVPDDGRPRLEGLDALSMVDAICVAMAGHPRLRAAGYRIDAATGHVVQAGLYPNPSLIFDAESLGADAGGGGETIYRVEQSIVLGGKLDRREAVARADRQATVAALRNEEFALASRVRRRYAAAVAAQLRRDKRTELAKLAGQLSEAVAAQADAGAATEPDRLRAELVVQQAQIELDSARREVAAARQSLASAIGVETLGELPLSSQLTELPELADRDELITRALRSNGRIAQARIAIERARRAHELARSQAVPDLVASIGPRYSDPDSEATLDIGLGIEVPLFDRNQGAIRAALAERLSVSAELRAVQLDLASEVADAWSAYQSARSAAVRYQGELLPKARRTLDLTRQAYQSGKLEYLRLLDAQQVLFESQIAWIDALERLHAAATLLDELTQTQTPWLDVPTTREAEPENTP